MAGSGYSMRDVYQLSTALPATDEGTVPDMDEQASYNMEVAQPAVGEVHMKILASVVVIAVILATMHKW